MQNPLFEVKGMLKGVSGVAILADFQKPGKGVVNIYYNGRYHAPIVRAYLDRKSCTDLSAFVGKAVILQGMEDVDHKKIPRLYLSIYGDSSLSTEGLSSVRILLVSEKDTTAGAWIKYNPCSEKLIYQEFFFSRGGTHWQRFLITMEEVISGGRMTATRNHHNFYEISI